MNEEIKKLENRISELEEITSILSNALYFQISYFETLLLSNPELEKQIHISGERPTEILQNQRFKVGLSQVK